MPRDDTAAQMPEAIECSLLDGFQSEFPLVSRPYAEIGERLGISEDDVLSILRRLRERRWISRVGAVLRPHSVGASTLAALAVPEDRLEDVAAIISAYPGVNHNYAREHRFNLWFVVTAPDERAVAALLDDIHTRTGLAPLDLPLLEAFHIDLGFGLTWN